MCNTWTGMGVSHLSYLPQWPQTQKLAAPLFATRRCVAMQSNEENRGQLMTSWIWHVTELLLLMDDIGRLESHVTVQNTVRSRVFTVRSNWYGMGLGMIVVVLYVHGKLCIIVHNCHCEHSCGVEDIYIQWRSFFRNHVYCWLKWTWKVSCMANDVVVKVTTPERQKLSYTYAWANGKMLK